MITTDSVFTGAHCVIVTIARRRHFDTIALNASEGTCSLTGRKYLQKSMNGDGVLTIFIHHLEGTAAR